MIDKPWNNRAWFFVLPVLAFVLFSSVIPMMTVVNYSVQNSMGVNNFFWNGDAWFRDLLSPSTEIGARFADALLRTFAFSCTALLIEVPLGIAIALCLPRRGWAIGISLVITALPMLIPWNVVGTMWQIFARADIGLFGAALTRLGLHYNVTQKFNIGLGDNRCHRCVALDTAGHSIELRGTAGHTRRLLPGGTH